MVAPSKTQLLNEVHTLLKKRYKLEPRAEKLSVLEAIVYGICHEGTTREQAEQALSRFREQFFDWNEVRVSSIEEIQGVFAGQNHAEERANRLRRFLRQLFDKTYEFSMDSLAKKPLKESVKLLSEYDAMGSDYVLATVIQLGLGGHAMPVDHPIRRGLIRLEIVEEGTDSHSVRSLLERAIPKNRASEFIDLIEELTHDTCVEGPPDCPRCELRKICPTGQTRQASDKTAARSAAKGKPATQVEVQATSIPEPKSVKAPVPKSSDVTAHPSKPITQSSKHDPEVKKPAQVNSEVKPAIPTTKSLKSRDPKLK